MFGSAVLRPAQPMPRVFPPDHPPRAQESAVEYEARLRILSANEWHFKVKTRPTPTTAGVAQTNESEPFLRGADGWHEPLPGTENLNPRLATVRAIR